MLRKQLVFIHGGTAFTRYEDFLEYLKTKPIDDPLVEREEKRWQRGLSSHLASTYDVFSLSMPNKQNAKYEEWKLWFERHFVFFRDEIVLMGHSLGGYFLSKYLSENLMAVQVKALLLLAAPFKNDDFCGEDGGDFAFNVSNLPRLREQIGEVHVLHSVDDPVVPFEHARLYTATLPGSVLHSFKDKNHFILGEFPELIELIQKI